MNAPPDAQARERIASDLHQSLFVGAGAGAGKTTALVGRITRLIIDGITEIHSLAAITFTEDAAAELRDRVREALERTAAGEAVKGTGDLFAGSLPTAQHRDRAAAALRDLDDAVLTTLHGFAQRIMASHAVECGLPPRFEVLDQQGSLVAFSDAWQSGLAELLAREDLRTPVERALALGMTANQMRSLARILDDNWDRLTDRVHQPIPTAPPVDTTPLLRILEALHPLEATCTNPDDRLLLHLQQILQFGDQLRQCTDDTEVLRCLRETTKIASSGGAAPAWGGKEGKAAVTDLLSQLQQAATEIVGRTADHAFRAILGALSDFVLANAEARRRAGVVTFHDLLVRSRNLLREHPEVAESLGKRFTHLLIDEFQDTDPIQAELVFRIAGTGPADADWYELTIEPGRVFFVGDPKQAIYRFRRADIALYLDTAALFEPGGVSMTTCFRSVPEIIEWVNAAFSPMFDAGEPRSQPPYESLAAIRPSIPATPPSVVYMGGPIESEDPGAKVNASDVRACAADDTARILRQAVSERWPVLREDGSVEPIRFRDMAILIPTRTSIGIMLDALDAASIPYSLRKTSMVFETPEIADLLNVVRAIAEPGNDLAVVAALRTPLYACSDSDLISWKLAGHSWDNAPPEATGQVARAIEHIHALHAQARWSTPAQLLERLIDDRSVLALLLDKPRFRDAWRRVRWLVDNARAFTESGGRGLHDWLHLIEVLSADGANATEICIDEQDDDAVQILTVHSSKGLEFPLVLLANLSSESKGSSTREQILWGPDGPEVSIRKDLATSGFAALASAEEVFAAHERVRLMYVAATRARDYLVLPLHHKAGSKATWAADLWQRRDDMNDIWVEATPPPLHASPLPVSEPQHLPETQITGSAEHAQWIQARSAAIQRAAQPLAVSPTQLTTTLDLAPSDDRTDLAVPKRHGRGGTALGRAVHAVLQQVDILDQSDLDALATAQAAADGFTERSAEIARLARHALASPTVAEAAHHPHQREMYVAVPIGGRILEGFIDLLVDSPHGLTVVDYKTALNATSEQIAERAEAYEPQAVAYALAVGKLLGRQVDRAVFVFLDGVNAIECEVSDLHDKVERLAGELRSGTAAGLGQ